MGDAALLDGYRHVEVASVSDAREKITGLRMHMSHRMRPIFPFQVCWDRTHGEIEERRKSRPRRPARYAGGNRPGRTEFRVTDGRRGRQRYCRHGRTEGNSDGFPEFSAAVIDGGVRDVAYLQKIGFPVFGLGIVPATSVNHYRFAGSNVPVVCDGVAVTAGDIVVVDPDGVVVVPRVQAAEVLTLAQEMDFKEHSMYVYIEKLRSIEEAVKNFGRL